MQEIGEVGGVALKVHLMLEYYVLLWLNNIMSELKLILRVDQLLVFSNLSYKVLEVNAQWDNAFYPLILMEEELLDQQKCIVT